jgi:choline dehydrogenase-like flavoprotein
MKSIRDSYEYIVVGSGAGGGTLVRELAKKGKDVLCIEWGPPVNNVGRMRDTYTFYDLKRFPDIVPSFMRKIPLLPPRTKEGIIIWRAVGEGGSTVISLGNGARCMEDELSSMGIDLDKESEETEREVGLDFVTERMLSKGSRSISEAAEKLGHAMVPMPKYVNSKKCVKCHRCLYGCEYNAKWDSRGWIREAQENGADLLYNTKVIEVSRSNGKVKGVLAKGPGGRIEIRGKTVILSAGGMATPALLQKSGIKEAGEGFFLDLFWNTYGITTDEGLNLDREPNMAMVALEWYNDDGFLLSPYMNHDRFIRLQEMSPFRAWLQSKRMLGIMTKITDDANGRVYPDGTCSKPLTERDRRRLKRGAGIAREILIKAGVKPGSLFESRIQGAHPGGAAAIGTVVDTDLQTGIDNLFVCDASVFPGREFNDKDRLPPILTIVALAKRLAKTLA